MTASWTTLAIASGEPAFPALGVAAPAPAAAEFSAAAIDLVDRLATANNVQAACRTLAVEVQRFLGCRRVAVGLVPQPESACALVALSDLVVIDSKTSEAQRLAQALDEVAHNHRTVTWPSRDNAVALPLPALERLATDGGEASLLAAPLRTVEGKLIGAWIAIGPQSVPTAETFLGVCSPTVATCLELLRRAEPNPLRCAWDRVASRLTRSMRLKLLAASVLLVAVGLVPIPFRVGCPCVVQPETRRVVAAPFEGVFESSLVKPGDVVTANQVLGRMDGRQARWELAGLDAEEHRAGKSRDVNLAAGKVAAAQIDKLEMERVAERRRVLQHRIENLDVKSPLEGLVIAGDLERSQGVPLTLGQVLYEIAPLDRMVVEIEISQDDVAPVETGESVSLRLDAYPGETWQGRLERIHPRAETRDNRSVFVAEVLLDNADGRLRPGMRGWSKIDSGRRALAWVWFHKPWYDLLGWLGW